VTWVHAKEASVYGYHIVKFFQNIYKKKIPKKCYSINKKNILLMSEVKLNALFHARMNCSLTFNNPDICNMTCKQMFNKYCMILQFTCFTVCSVGLRV
jgi:hypothetical protein